MNKIKLYIKNLLFSILGKKRFKLIKKYSWDFFIGRKNLIDTYITFSKQKKCLENNNYRTLIVGSSHAYHGVIGKIIGENCFNVSHGNQDWAIGYNLLKHFLSKQPKLKKVYFFCSVFSQGYDLSKTNEYWKPLVYDFVLTGKLDKKLNLLDKIILKILSSKNIKAESNYLGGSLLNGNNLSQDKNKVLSHYKNNQRANNVLKVLENVIDICKKHNVEIDLVVAPLSKKYISLLPNNDYTFLFSSILEIAKNKSIKIHNFYKDNNFNDADFYDIDHLNKQGAEKLSKLLSAQIKE
jgi:hypothetical protein